MVRKTSWSGLKISVLVTTDMLEIPPRFPKKHLVVLFLQMQKGRFDLWLPVWQPRGLYVTYV